MLEPWFHGMTMSLCFLFVFFQNPSIADYGWKSKVAVDIDFEDDDSDDGKVMAGNENVTKERRLDDSKGADAIPARENFFGNVPTGGKLFIIHAISRMP